MGESYSERDSHQHKQARDDAAFHSAAPRHVCKEQVIQDHRANIVDLVRQVSAKKLRR
jgi:hypothetical protein